MWVVDALIFFLPEVPAYFIATALMQRLGHPPSITFKHSLAGTLALFAAVSVPAMFFNATKFSALDDLVIIGFLATIGLTTARAEGDEACVAEVVTSSVGV